MPPTWRWPCPCPSTSSSQYPVVTWGTPEQHARWLPAMLRGEALGAFALTEPHAGSDAAAIRTRANASGRPMRRPAIA